MQVSWPFFLFPPQMMFEPVYMYSVVHFIFVCLLIVCCCCCYCRRCSDAYIAWNTGTSNSPVLFTLWKVVLNYYDLECYLHRPPSLEISAWLQNVMWLLVVWICEILLSKLLYSVHINVLFPIFRHLCDIQIDYAKEMAYYFLYSLSAYGIMWKHFPVWLKCPTMLAIWSMRRLCFRG